VAFSEVIKLKVKRQAHFRCCLCHSLDVEIHHVIPQAEDGPDTEDNAAPLCPSCHSTYGGNPEKRKFIREARDFWYEYCAKRLSLDRDLQPISEALKDMATKEDLKILAIQNSSYVLGQAAEGAGPFWEHLRYSFIREDYIHPLVVRELLGWFSDSGETVVSIDLVQANQSNQFDGDYSHYEKDGCTWVEWKSERESFSYSHIATSSSGVHMVECYYWGGGSGIFGFVSLLAFECDRSLGNPSSGDPFTRERVLIKTLGTISLGDRYAGDIDYRGGLLTVGPDEGWFSRGEETRREIPIR